MMSDTIFVLGAPDPEMVEIEKVIRSKGCQFVYACKDGVRVHPGNAYNADVFDREGKGLVWVECGGMDLTTDDLIVDHHRDGDPGFDLPPSRYLEGSSLGQIMAMLSINPTPLQRIIAAADHCPLAAYQGQCPGIDPDKLGEWRIECRARHQGRPKKELKEEIESAIKKLKDADLFEGMKIRDMRGEFVPELPEAGLRSGMAYLAGPLPNRDGREKYVIGAAERRIVEHWMDWADAQGWDVYGSPVRGYAGGFPPEKG